MPLTEQEKIRALGGAFEKFLKKIVFLLDKEKQLFERTMERVEQRKIKELRGKIVGIYKKRKV